MRSRFRVAVLLVAALLAGALSSASASEPRGARPINDDFREAVVIPGVGVTDTINSNFQLKERCELGLTPWGRDTQARANTMPPMPWVTNGITSDPDATLAVTSHDSATRYMGHIHLRSVWWQWTAGRTRSVTISTGLSRNRAGRGLNTMLAVYRGRAANRNLCEARPYISQVAWDDNSGPGPTSRVQFRAVRGRHYYILVDGFPRWHCSEYEGFMPPGEKLCNVDAVSGNVRVRLSNT
jgi:hypothetical protein